MKTYQVGGAVRDELLGLPVKDRDWVVVGATPEELVRLGYRPVGKDFPVFLHPQTHEEYALARTERKTARGYAGFQVHAAPDVTLEQDLARRDLTINAIARDAGGTIIDPFGGAADLAARVLRHVGDAFVEDPVRVLRVARFAARFDFDVAPETLALMRAMVHSGEVDALVPERVWQELARGLMERNPRRMFETLAECGALERILPEWTGLDAARALGALDAAAHAGAGLAVRWAVLFAGAPRALAQSACDRLKVPTECRELAVLAATFRRAFKPASDAAELLEVLLATDALRRPERFAQWMDVCRFDGVDPRALARLARARGAAATVNAGAIAGGGAVDIVAAIRAARIAAIAAALQ